jgi:lipopolysaccharide/colanic/teichoic acid biosynthesis glycosyltransferase
MAAGMKLYARFGKRLFDVSAASAGLGILAPVLLVLAACVKLSDGGPVFFAQERMGRNFKKFRLFKFRTMVVGAEKIGHAVTKGGDPRITKIGAFLRHYKLDELPQLFNVLKGDMSIVGPRPEVEKYVRAFEDEYTEILTIRPGITDYATLLYRNEEEILNRFEDAHAGYLAEVLPAKIALYRQYLKDMSFVTDLRIIFMTLWRIVA